MRINICTSVKHDELLKEWSRFLEKFNKDSNPNPVKVQPWKGYQELGIEPHDIKFIFLTDEELAHKRSENMALIQAAKPYMQHLSLVLSDNHHVVALTDCAGWIIELVAIGADKSSGFVMGASRAESYIGNNGIGTSLATGSPVFVYGVEHYASVYKTWACLGIPIRDSYDKVLGAISVAVPIEYAHPERMALVISCVASIETSLAGNLKKIDEEKISLSGKINDTESLLLTAVHDLRNPLTVIQGLSQLGAMTASTDKEKLYFDQVLSNTHNLSIMINNLLDIFTPEKFTQIAAKDILEDIYKDYDVFCDYNNISLSLTIQDNQIILVKKKLFKRALSNLIINAKQAITCAGAIEIKAYAADNEYIIQVLDTGPGIPAEIQDTIFEPFVHHKKNGQGLGLYMVYKTITEVHQGQIEFETYPDIGTCFTIKLPIGDLMVKKIGSKKKIGS